jgi:uncharacterized membrane protein YdcZ (DUF606 family)
MNDHSMGRIFRYLQSLGVAHPIYLFTVAFLLVAYFLYKDDFRRWRELDKLRKFHLIAGVICGVGLILMSLLTFLGVFGD